MNTRKQPQPARKTGFAQERLRQSYRPDRVRVLFVGEAPPASGRFFYQEDSGLYHAVKGTFIRALPSLRKNDFLESFRDLGCYLVDLCGTPVDQLDRKSRQKVCKDGEVRLSQVFKKYHPDAVVTLVRSIEANVTRAKRQAHWIGQSLDLPYPGRWHQHRRVFEKKLIRFLRQSLK